MFEGSFLETRVPYIQRNNQGIDKRQSRIVGCSVGLPGPLSAMVGQMEKIDRRVKSWPLGRKGKMEWATTERDQRPGLWQDVTRSPLGVGEPG